MINSEVLDANEEVGRSCACVGDRGLVGHDAAGGYRRFGGMYSLSFEDAPKTWND
jgi:hypothetical protein